VGSRLVIGTVVSVFSIALFVASIASLPRQGYSDETAIPFGSCGVRVTSVGGAAAAEGLRVGDVIQLDKMDPAARLLLTFPAAAGTQVDWPVQRGTTSSVVRVTYQAVPGLNLFGPIIRIAFLVFGLIAFWRGRDQASLGLGVFFCGTSTIIGSEYAALSPAALIVAAFVVCIFGALALVGLVYLAIALAAPYFSARWLRIAWILAWIGAAVYCVSALSAQLAVAVLGCSNFNAVPIAIGGFTLEMFVAMTLLGGTLRKAPAALRGRVRWIYWCTGLGFAGPFFGVVIVLLGLPPPKDDWYNLTILLIPLGYAYAVLRHRVVDIGFAINRALVYGALTTVIVGILAIAESLLAKAAIGRGAGLTLELAVALGLGLSFNALHAQIDRLVDRVFFRKKHEAEEALNRLAHESAFIEKPGALLDRAIDDVFRHSGASGCAIYERDRDAYRLVRERGAERARPTIDADDIALVRMRATPNDVELEDVESVLGSHGLAVPMTVRGGLIGVLVLAPRVDGEPYSPDERALLRQVARDVAAALHAMQAKDHADLVGALASGLIDASAAQIRARELRSIT
jgi:hypothetical protein